MDRNARVFAMSFASVYPLYVRKAERKGRTQAEVDAVIAWLTGHDARGLRRAIDSGVDLETFFAKAPRMNPDARLVQGVVCGVRVEEVADPLMRKVRQLDKLVDELARGKELSSILHRDPERARTPRTDGAAPRTGAAPSRSRRPGSRPARASARAPRRRRGGSPGR
jgi:hypothetical protein